MTTMNKMTLLLPMGRNGAGPALYEKEAAGVVIGPFLVHRGIDIRSHWTVTHINTRRAVLAGLPTKRRADWLARKLAELNVWQFECFEDAKLIPTEVLAAIKVLRADAMYGDMQGGDPCP